MITSKLSFQVHKQATRIKQTISNPILTETTYTEKELEQAVEYAIYVTFTQWAIDIQTDAKSIRQYVLDRKEAVKGFLRPKPQAPQPRHT